MLSESERKAFGDFEKRGWDQAADPYHRHWGVLTRQSSESLLDAACVQAGAKVLDVATGAGYVAAAAHQRGAIAIGLDFSPVQVELARKTYTGMEFRQGDAENLPFEAARFDAVVMGLCLLHLPHAERAVAERHSVCSDPEAISLQPSGRSPKIIRPSASCWGRSIAMALRSIFLPARPTSASLMPMKRDASFGLLASSSR